MLIYALGGAFVMSSLRVYTMADHPELVPFQRFGTRAYWSLRNTEWNGEPDILRKKKT